MPAPHEGLEEPQGTDEVERIQTDDDPERVSIDVQRGQALEERLRGAGEVRRNDYLVRFGREGTELVVFPDGRALVKGVADVAQARSLYARYVGS